MTLDELSGDAGGDDDPGGERQGGRAGLDRPVAEDLLHVEHDQDKNRPMRPAPTNSIAA
jgi:hypothetical protein